MRRGKSRGKALAVTIEHIHHDIAVAIRQDNLPLIAVLHTLDERDKSLVPHIDNGKAEQFSAPPNGICH